MRWRGTWWLGLLLLGLAQFGCNQNRPGGSSVGSGNVRPTPKSAPDAGYRFAAPTRLEADGGPIAVEAPGYACPTMADVDADGQLDLVVGQFANGNMQFFRNVAAAGQPPQFASAQWIMTGDERAVVPGVW